MNEKKRTRLLQGTVVSDVMNETIVVESARTYRHQVVGKVMRVTKKYKVHNANQQAKKGDIVEFYEGRPISKTKYMYLARVVHAPARSTDEV
jgi:small subunit ribosomal protein S17